MHYLLNARSSTGNDRTLLHPEAPLDTAQQFPHVDRLAHVVVTSRSPADASCSDACLSALDGDGDNDVDLEDFAAFQASFTGN